MTDRFLGSPEIFRNLDIENFKVSNMYRNHEPLHERTFKIQFSQQNKTIVLRLLDDLHKGTFIIMLAILAPPPKFGHHLWTFPKLLFTAILNKRCSKDKKCNEQTGYTIWFNLQQTSV